MTDNRQPSIRLATDADAAELARLMVAFDNPPRTPEQQRALMHRAAAHERAFVAELDGRLIAFLCLKFAPMISQPAPFAEVTDLFVEERYRRRGIARALMHAAEQSAREQGASGMWLITGFKNEDAQNLYRSIGFLDWSLAMKRVF